MTTTTAGALERLKKMLANSSVYKVLYDAFLAEIQEVFFEAMNAGYAAGEKPKKGTIAELPGSKTIPYVRRPWEVLDVYHVTPLSSYSGGTTLISYEGIPVWMMQYFGHYTEETIPCLKAALRAAYSKKVFFGGRGPEKFEYGNGEFVYGNKKQVIHKHDFVSFNGAEHIFNKKGEHLGRHEYQGGILF